MISKIVYMWVTMPYVVILNNFKLKVGYVNDTKDIIEINIKRNSKIMKRAETVKWEVEIVEIENESLRGANMQHNHEHFMKQLHLLRSFYSNKTCIICVS